MKVIIAGSRTIEDYDIVKKAIREANFNITEVVCGMASGVDSLGERYALEHFIPVTYFPADWKKMGKSAGYIRNEEMAKYGEALIAVIENTSKGTMHMIELAKKYKLVVYVKILDNTEKD